MLSSYYFSAFVETKMLHLVNGGAGDTVYRARAQLSAGGNKNPAGVHLTGALKGHQNPTAESCLGNDDKRQQI